MKNLLLLIVFFLLLVSGCREDYVDPINSPDINNQYESGPTFINNPGKNEMLEKGSTIIIKWDNFNADVINIYLIRKKTYTIANIAENVKNENYYEWTIPYDIPNSIYYQIKLESSKNSDYYLFSAIFNIFD